MAENPNKFSETLSSSSSSLSDTTNEDEAEVFSDSDLLQKILPEEVWLIITEKVLTKRNEKDDIAGHFEFLSHSSPYFRTLLKPKRISIWFELVFWIASPWILATSEDDMGNPSDSDSENDLETIEEYSDTDSTSGYYNRQVDTPKRKPISVIKSCREVCSEWNLAISQLIHKKHIRHNQRGLHSFERKVIEKMEYEEFENTTQAQKFLNFFKATHANQDRSPFITRHVRITLQCEDKFNDEDPEYPHAIEALLDTYGRHILDLDVIVQGFNTDVDEQLRNIARGIKYVQMVPNLRRLHFADYAFNFFGTLEEALRESHIKIKKKAEYQLPHIPTLVELKTSGLADPIYYNLRKNNRKVCLKFRNP